MNYRKFIIPFLINLFAQNCRATGSEFDEFSSTTNFFESRVKRGDKYHVKCHQSGTGTFTKIPNILLSGYS